MHFIGENTGVCVCVCACACMHVCVCVCVCVVKRIKVMFSHCLMFVNPMVSSVC